MDSEVRGGERRDRARVALAGGGFAALASALVFFGPAGAPRAPAQSSAPANVVVIMTDDQDPASVAAMPTVRERIGEAGATFERAIVNFPLCCPSRATFLTGQYPHNHHVLNNSPPAGGVEALDESNTLPVWLSTAGYRTAMVGKYLNGYERTDGYVPAGWSRWIGIWQDVYGYYGYTLMEGDVPTRYGVLSENPREPGEPDTYSSDLLSDKAIETIKDLAPGAQPYFLWLSYLAPHGGGPSPPDTRCHAAAVPAARHWGEYDSQSLPSPPSLNEADVSDKPRAVRSIPPITEEGLARLEDNWRCRRESLLAVDQGIRRVFDALDATGELDQTLVIFTSDNGFMYGEHRLQRAKRHPYEEAIRVPLMLRGPGIPPGTRVTEPVVNNDLAATIAEVAGATPGLAVDGRSLIPIAQRPAQRLGREILIRAPGWIGLRTERFTFVRRHPAQGGGVELYDLRIDPFQLESVHDVRRYAAARKALRRRLTALQGCSGARCLTRPRLYLRSSCRRGRLTIRIAGRDRDQVTTARFRSGPRVRLYVDPPFSHTAGRHDRAPVQVRAVLVDGRVLSMRAGHGPYAECRR